MMTGSSDGEVVEWREMEEMMLGRIVTKWVRRMCEEKETENQLNQSIFPVMDNLLSVRYELESF